MARPSTKFKLGKRTFVINHWSPSEFLNKGAHISKFIAVPAGMTLGSMAQGYLREDESVNGDGLGDAMMWLFSQLQDDAASELMQFILEGVVLDGEDIDLDETFAEDPCEMFDVAAKVLEVNYAPFFKKRGFGNLMQTMGKLNNVMQTFRQV